MSVKGRISATIDQDVLDGCYRVLRSGDAPSLSALINRALRVELERVDKVAAAGRAIEAYEKEFGAFTPEEEATIDREMAARTIKVKDRKIYYPDGRIEAAVRGPDGVFVIEVVEPGAGR